jgi:excinuclease UvrABC ATPase subunit
MVCQSQSSLNCRSLVRSKPPAKLILPAATPSSPAASCTRSSNASNSSMPSALGYLSLDRSAAPLSGGEGQRIRLATQIGSKPPRRPLRPRRALHRPAPARQPAPASHALEDLRDLGNTVLVVEHDEDTIRKADYVSTSAPAPARHGGFLIAQRHAGEMDERVLESLTGA